jgi:hypothetical protein
VKEQRDVAAGGGGAMGRNAAHDGVSVVEGEGVDRWRRIVGEWRQSGLSAREFAECRGVSAGMIYAWSSRLGKQDTGLPRATQARPETPPRFLPVAIIDEAPPASQEPSDALEVVLPRGEVIRVSPGADLSHLGRVIAALRGGAS